jgi:hypothetical protein
MFHLYFGKIPPEKFDANIRYLYFVRRTNAAIEKYGMMDDCFSEMAGKFIVASVQKDTLEYVEEVINHLFVTAILHQFREPNISKTTAPQPEQEVVDTDTPSGKSEILKFL